MSEVKTKAVRSSVQDKLNRQIESSDYISRDLSWMRFNLRVLDQARTGERTLLERMKFLAITSSNLDEFFIIRLGSLYNYIDYNKERVDYSGLREVPFRKRLLSEAQTFNQDQNEVYAGLEGDFKKNGFSISGISNLKDKEKEKVANYFMKTVYPMLTPMVFDSYHTFPILANKVLIFGVVTRSAEDLKNQKRLSFIQVPQNLPRFFELDRGEHKLFVPIEEIIEFKIHKLFRNIEIISVNLFRITRNGDFTLEESDDIEADFIEEVRRKLKTRRTGRVVRIETGPKTSSWMMKVLKQRWAIEDDNVFINPRLIDYTGLWQIVNHEDFRQLLPQTPPTVPPLSWDQSAGQDLFTYLKTKDIMLHHPYNNMQPLVQLLSEAAEDPGVLAIKITIYRLAKDSDITSALLKAAENGKHVSVLFELKARFDEENNIREAQRLQKAGCFVIYGIGTLKTHTKLCLIVRKEKDSVTSYVHMSSGNYNESTAKLYTDIGILSTNEAYAHDVSEFFNAITGHSMPSHYEHLITAPRGMRPALIRLMADEAKNAQEGKPSGIVIKINSMEDQETIDALYAASQAGVQVKLTVRGICCLRPGRKGLSENISVRSIVGDYLEHTRLFYFHNAGDPKVYGGSADMMVRSFERRIESLFLIIDPLLRQQAINILAYNQKDNVNAYEMHTDGSYEHTLLRGEEPFNIHKEFYDVTVDKIRKAVLFP